MMSMKSSKKTFHHLARPIWMMLTKRNSQEEDHRAEPKCRGSRAVKGGGLKILCVGFAGSNPAPGTMISQIFEFFLRIAC